MKYMYYWQIYNSPLTNGTLYMNLMNIANLKHSCKMDFMINMLMRTRLSMQLWSLLLKKHNYKVICMIQEQILILDMYLIYMYMYLLLAIYILCF